MTNVTKKRCLMLSDKTSYYYYNYPTSYRIENTEDTFPSPVRNASGWGSSSASVTLKRYFDTTPLCKTKIPTGTIPIR